MVSREGYGRVYGPDGRNVSFAIYLWPVSAQTINTNPLTFPKLINTPLIHRASVCSDGKPAFFWNNFGSD